MDNTQQFNSLTITEDELKRLTIATDFVSVDIYVDNGEDDEPRPIIYWNSDEWEEDLSILGSVFNAIQLYYIDKRELVELVGFTII